MSEASEDCYDLPQYWDLAFDDDTQAEADFVEAAAKRYCEFPVRRLLEPGCGGGRLVVELSSRGYDVTGWDLSQPAVDYANRRLQQAGLTGQVHVADMISGQEAEPFDIAYCYVNTFRHLLTDADAIQHLRTVAGQLRSGGLYIIGLHLFPPDADEEDSEDWSVTQNGTTVHMRLDVAACDRELRQETLRFEMAVVTEGNEQPSHRFLSDYRMRLYSADDIQQLFAEVPEFRVMSEVYDFWYDIDDPLTLSDEMGDTVFVLQKL